MAFEGSPARAIRDALGGELGASTLGAIVARPGVGKTLLLVHLAVDHLVAGRPVLHVALRDPVEHVRAHYDEALRALAVAGAFEEPRASAMAAERNRMIHSWLDKSFDAAALRAHLEVLSSKAEFRPSLVVVDGIEPDADLEGLVALAAETGTPIWVTMRAGARLPVAAVVLELGPVGRSVGLSLSRDGKTQVLPVWLDCATMLVASDTSEDSGADRPLDPSERTLLTGGATGSEAAFGEEAERWGVREVAYTFDGHRQARTRGSLVLTPRELAAGDVSLKYVSTRLHRTYANESGLIRKVLQTLWHMVSRSQQVFVVGQIQPDGTVTGGTGWSVELARMWGREVWVFDQERGGWFRWVGAEWTPGEARITARYFCGTGTRYLDASGRAAIAGLFDRSFSADAG